MGSIRQNMTGFPPRLAHVKHEEAVIIVWGSSKACGDAAGARSLDHCVTRGDRFSTEGQ